ncbi:MAG: YhcH/YjgK/YiaL family protein [Desulfovibrionaceae bacterium]|nr:YhcH/YjgK/YiaL family protein [Desulfovibrionaceae bacterium]
MITGFIRQWDKEKYCYPKAFDTAIAYLRNNDLLNLEEGKYPIDGDKIFAMIQKTTTAPVSERRYELHRDYIDIQVLLKGREQHWYSIAYPATKPTEDLLDSKDLAFHPAPENALSLIVSPWQYIVYLPCELHCPACSVDGPESIFKAVLKIHRSCV